MSGPKNRNLRGIGPIYFIFERKNKWALPAEALERPCGPICAILALFALWRQKEVPTYFFASRRFYITKQKMKQMGPIPRKLWPFESTPGHPSRE